MTMEIEPVASLKYVTYEPPPGSRPDPDWFAFEIGTTSSDSAFSVSAMTEDHTRRISPTDANCVVCAAAHNGG